MRKLCEKNDNMNKKVKKYIVYVNGECYNRNNVKKSVWGDGRNGRKN